MEDVKVAAEEAAMASGTPVDPASLDAFIGVWRASAESGAELTEKRRDACAAELGMHGLNLAMIEWRGEPRVLHWSRVAAAAEGDGQLCNLDNDYVKFPVNVKGIGRDTLVHNYGPSLLAKPN